MSAQAGEPGLASVAPVTSGQTWPTARACPPAPMAPGPKAEPRSRSRVIRVVVAASYPVVRRYLEELLAASPDLEVVAVAGDADEVLAATDAHQPDVCCWA